MNFRHADQLAFEVALADWKRATANPEQHPRFLQAYANELRDLLIKANRRSKVIREVMEQLEKSDWRSLIQRELHSETWFTLPNDEQEVPTHVVLPLAETLLAVGAS